MLSSDSVAVNVFQTVQIHLSKQIFTSVFRIWFSNLFSKSGWLLIFPWLNKQLLGTPFEYSMSIRLRRISPFLNEHLSKRVNRIICSILVPRYPVLIGCGRWMCWKKICWKPRLVASTYTSNLRRASSNNSKQQKREGCDCSNFPCSLFKSINQFYWFVPMPNECYFGVDHHAKALSRRRLPLFHSHQWKTQSMKKEKESMQKSKSSDKSIRCTWCTLTAAVTTRTESKKTCGNKSCTHTFHL